VSFTQRLQKGRIRKRKDVTERNRTEQNTTTTKKIYIKKKTVECYFSFHSMIRVPVVMFHSTIVQMRPVVCAICHTGSRPASQHKCLPPITPFPLPHPHTTYLPIIPTHAARPDLNFPVRSTAPTYDMVLLPCSAHVLTYSAVPHQQSAVPCEHLHHVIWHYLRLTCIRQTSMAFSTGNPVVCWFGLVILLLPPLTIGICVRGLTTTIHPSIHSFIHSSILCEWPGRRGSMRSSNERLRWRIYAQMRIWVYPVNGFC